MQDPLHPSNLGSSPVLQLFHGSSNALFEYSSPATPDASFDNRLVLLEHEYVEYVEAGFPREFRVCAAVLILVTLRRALLPCGRATIHNVY